MKKIAVVLAILVMTIHLVVQFEHYRIAVEKDTKIYLNCRMYYHKKAWHDSHELKEVYSQKMCHDDWSWWNYEIWHHKFEDNNADVICPGGLY